MSVVSKLLVGPAVMKMQLLIADTRGIKRFDDIMKLYIVHNYRHICLYCTI